MLQQTDELRLAVLIDGENVSAAIVERLFEAIEKLGRPTVRRIFGNIRNAQMMVWEEKLLPFAIQSRHQSKNAKGKNSADIALVIEAMDLLHRDRLDGICLVSSDSDFTLLASRYRETGAKVYVFGETKTPESLRRASTRFFNTDAMRQQSDKNAHIPTELANKPLPLSHFTPIIKTALSNLEPKDGWYVLSAVGSQLRRIKNGFESKHYGYKQLMELVRQTGAYEIEHSKGSMPRIRPKLS